MVAGLAFGSSIALAGETAAEIGKPAPNFELKNYDGKTVKLEDHKGKIVVIEWICQNCPVSKGKLETMIKLANEYKEKDVVWLAIDSSAKGHAYFTTDDAKHTYATENKIPYPILTDADGKVGKAYGAKTTPHMFIIDKEGKLVYSGAIDDKGETNYVSQTLNALLEGSQVPVATTTPYGCSVKYAS
jgi:peroxiredoxin